MLSSDVVAVAVLSGALTETIAALMTDVIPKISDQHAKLRHLLTGACAICLGERAGVQHPADSVVEFEGNDMFDVLNGAAQLSWIDHGSPEVNNLIRQIVILGIAAARPGLINPENN